MKGLTAAVRAKVGEKCLARHCNKQRCRVSLSGAPTPNLLIDFDKRGAPLSEQEQRCDYLFIAEDDERGWIAPLELKSGSLDASEVAGQLRAGAEAAERLVPRSERSKTRFRPVAVYGGELRTAQRNKLRQGNNLVRFHGKAEVVRTIRCGQPLMAGLRKTPSSPQK